MNLFTIIIPTFNSERTIETTLDSLNNQTYKDFSVIIIDNHSTDSTINIINSLNLKFDYKLVINEKNEERAYSRNLGMFLAESEFLTFLDSDDILLEDYFKDASFFLKYNNNKIFHCHYVLYNFEKKLITYKYKFNFLRISNQYKRISQGNFLSCIGVFISKEIYKKYKFDNDLKIIGSEDWDFWFRILADYKLGVIPNVNAKILDHNNRSIYKFDVNEILERKLNILKKIKKNNHLSNKYKIYLTLIEATIYLYIIPIYIKQKDSKNIFKYLKKSIDTRKFIFLESMYFYVILYQIFKYYLLKIKIYNHHVKL